MIFFLSLISNSHTMDQESVTQIFKLIGEECTRHRDIYRHIKKGIR